MMFRFPVFRVALSQYRKMHLVVFACILLGLVAARAQTPGSLDALNVAVGSGESMPVVATQPDGKILIAGDFQSVNSIVHQRIARLNTDGTVDSSFNPQFNGPILSLALQKDGKILIAGGFTAFYPNGSTATPTARWRIARLNPDGSLDASFDPWANGLVSGLLVQPDGKIVISGAFSVLQPNGAAAGTVRNKIARIHADGALDNGFNLNPNGDVAGIALQPDGKILLGGVFSSLQPNGATTATVRKGIARVNADGALDMAFNPNPSGNQVSCILVQPDEKILVGGYFYEFRPPPGTTTTSRSNIARLNANGTVDLAFNPTANAPVYSLSLQADGKVILGGEFTTLRPNGAASATTRNYIARVHANGSLDTGFESKPNGSIISVGLQADGKVLVGGNFNFFNSGTSTATPRRLLARLHNDAATQTLTAPGGTQLLWNRGGAAPELSQVTFEQSTDGGTVWTALGNGSRVGTTANWQLSGLALPTAGKVRARGRTHGGYFNNSSWWVESAITLTAPSNIAMWRTTYFGSATANIGNLDDFDHDGAVNLLEFACGTNPANAASGLKSLQYTGTFAGSGVITATGQPITLLEGSDIRALFVRRKDYLAAGLTYTPRFSATLASWDNSVTVPTVLGDDGTWQIVSVPYPALVGGQVPHFFSLSLTISPPN
ncbi:MAG: hypothetical protein RLZZ398_1535 [Verrucomicrobiota bacterium]|jgi:uncharacterized delta-60 repeat protein